MPPARMTPDIVRYYSERIAQLQKQVDHLTAHMHELDQFETAQASRHVMSPDYARQFHVAIQKARDDARFEISRINNAVSQMRSRIEQFKAEHNFR